MRVTPSIVCLQRTLDVGVAAAVVWRVCRHVSCACHRCLGQGLCRQGARIALSRTLSCSVAMSGRRSNAYRHSHQSQTQLPSSALRSCQHPKGMADSRVRQDIWSLLYEDRAFLKPSGASLSGRRYVQSTTMDGQKRRSSISERMAQLIEALLTARMRSARANCSHNKMTSFK